MPEKYDELSGAVLILDRNGLQSHVASLVETCRCINGDFMMSDGTELPSPMEAMTYLFEHPEVEGYLGWSADVGYIALEFECDGSLIVIWSEQAVTLETAIEVVEEIARVVWGDRGYVSLGGWLPGSHNEFNVGFEGATLHRFSQR